jgi:DtxR family Mn-dependent transcriptional regulator
MAGENGLDLPARKVEYLKYIYEHGGTAKTVDLATHFSVDASTISKTISDLTDRGFLTHAPYQRITLSPEGKRYAGFFVKRHRILSLMLTHYGFSHEDACEEASRFESYVSKDAVDRICRTMGHPQEGACGSITHDTGCRGDGVRPKSIAENSSSPAKKMRMLP